jgi:hypothetical protein
MRLHPGLSRHLILMMLSAPAKPPINSNLATKTKLPAPNTPARSLLPALAGAVLPETRVSMSSLPGTPAT